MLHRYDGEVTADATFRGLIMGMVYAKWARFIASMNTFTRTPLDPPLLVIRQSQIQRKIVRAPQQGLKMQTERCMCQCGLCVIRPTSGECIMLL